MGWGDIPRVKPLFAVPGRYNRPDVQAAVLAWLDQHVGAPELAGQGFVEWKPLDHPTLGDVEIGGFTQFWLRNPPPGPFLRKVLEDQARFAVVRALLTPRTRIQDVSVVRGTDGGSWEITATVANEGYLDTSMQQAREARIARPDQVSLELGGDVATEDALTVEFPFMRGTRESAFTSLYRATWRVTGPEGASVTVTLRSEKGGTDRRRLELRETG
jgi:hypothetical protein